MIFQIAKKLRRFIKLQLVKGELISNLPGRNSIREKQTRRVLFVLAMANSRKVSFSDLPEINGD